jgi:hypothetical protein
MSRKILYADYAMSNLSSNLDKIKLPIPEPLLTCLRTCEVAQDVVDALDSHLSIEANYTEDLDWLYSTFFTRTEILASWY